MADGSFTPTVTKEYGAFGGLVQVCSIAVNAGDYAAGGLVCNLLGVARGTKLPVFVLIQGVGGFGYEWVDGTDLSDGKIQVRVATSTGGGDLKLDEHSVAALVAGVTGDTIKGIFFYPGNIS